MTSPFAVIVGAGPVGLMLANLLGKSGADVVLLERRTEPHTVPRAIAYDAESLRLFQKINLLDALEPTLERDVPVAYYNQSGKTLMRMSKPAKPYGHSQLGSFYQPEMEAVLADGLEQYPNVEVKRGTPVTGIETSGAKATVTYADTEGTEHQLFADYVIACDGGQSYIRETLGIGFGGNTFSEKWLVVDCINEGYGVREMQFFCDPRRPSLTLPVSKGRRRWEFLLMKDEDPDVLASDASVRKLIAAYAPDDRSEIERAVVYTFHARYADKFREGRVLLAGDAAHVNPPFAGQGLNGGLRDAHNLAWKLDLVRRGIAGDALLDTYETERRPHVKEMTDFAVQLGGAIMPTSSIKAGLRDLSMGLMNLIPGHKDRVDSGGLLPRPRMSDGSVRGKAKQAGFMLVQPEVSVRGETVLLDGLIGEGWAVIGIGTDPAPGLSSSDRTLLEALSAQFVTLDQTASAALTDQIGAGNMAVVRPDRFIAEILSPAPSRPRLGWLANSLSVSGGIEQ